MKKFKLLALALMLVVPFSAFADEGMWLLPLLEKMNIKTMKQNGCKLTAKQIYDINNSSLKDAIMIFGGGCTAEVVSGQGLVFTNHHCGYGSIQKLSSTEHDYLRDGFWAMNQSEELPAPGLTVTFIDRFIDVTDQMLEAEKKAEELGGRKAEEFIRKFRDSLTKEAVGDNKYLNARVYSFYQGNAYYVVVSKTFRDIRFVGAPPSSIGKFGGETDNWEWPRHTGDFSVFRIYADKDNNPADYSEDNVPYSPKKFLSISLKGYKPGDFAMIIGFPGSTDRYLTSQEVIDRRDAQNEPRIVARTAKEDVWRAAMRADQKTNIQYASKFASSSNYRKNSIGMNETFAKLGTADRRAEEEKLFNEWASQTPERQAEYGDCIETINKAVEKRSKPYAALVYLMETLNNVEVLQPASRALRAKNAEEFLKATENFYKDYSPELDRKTSKVLLKTFKENVTEPTYIPQVYKTIDEQFGGSIDKYVDNIFDKTVFTTKEKAKAALDDENFDPRKDPAVQYLMEFSTSYRPMMEEVNQDSEAFAKAKKTYMKGLLEMNGNNPIYPDANFTMRLTYGKVGGYAPKDAVTYNYYTTLDGVMQKENPDDPEFVVPAKLKELYLAKDYGKYALPSGEMPVCFLTNNDITGGNSGSDVLNAKGELIGLAFDGNWEAMSGDIIFEPNLQRCINVDIRYVLFIIDKFGGAGYLLNEMDIKQ
ncbi:MAG: S46 family peptidase [Bacteroidales bacterium]|nr:S46 family peptidase [Bacteroidales bacterium]MBQ2492935.1 S46 family peptidase [Bacteroidales bacterium]MBQ4196633.1 S46 family peptidase [Bacteroidales bacterium]